MADIAELAAAVVRANAAAAKARAVAREAQRDADDAKAALMAELPVGGRFPVDGHLVRVDQRKPAAQVVDEAALLEWVAANRADELEAVPTIKPTFRNTIVKLGGTDPETGEVIPGVELVQGDPFVVVTDTKPDA